MERWRGIERGGIWDENRRKEKVRRRRQDEKMGRKKEKRCVMKRYTEEGKDGKGKGKGRTCNKKTGEIGRKEEDV